MKHLGQLKLKELARIASIDVEHDTVGQRLMAMGIMPGQLIKIVNVAPLGDPIVVVVGNITVSLRRADATCVRVTDPDAVDYHDEKSESAFCRNIDEKK